MFGYVTANYKALSEEDREVYRRYYCGLCRALGRRYGNLSRMTLNNDMTFLLILLSSLYEPDEKEGKGRCILHPVKRRAYIQSGLCAYCADMTVLLAYHKAMDDRSDDGGLKSTAGFTALKKPYREVKALYPQKADRIEGYLAEIGDYEAGDGQDIDVPVNLSGKFLGEVFRYRDDAWGGDLQALGEGLGRFIYLMDAYDDLAADENRGRYNALGQYREQDDFEAFCEESLLMMIAECTSVFETLPLENHLSILRNVLYSGVWMRYWQKNGKRGQEEQGDEA
ncbi:MAG: hypothetical protein JW811_07195 [Clostridiales bacterium]|nr:hypothetical protein [Clostridiales bacterium]